MPSAVTDPWWELYGQYGDAVVMHVDLLAHGSRELEALAWLDQAERSQWDSYRYPGPRNRFGLCRSALRIILADRLGCKGDEISFGAGKHGKPVAMVRGVPVNADFNVSHSGHHGMIAFRPDGRIGVDVEERVDRPYLVGLIDSVLTRKERSEIEYMPSDVKVYAFYRFWTIKEAIIKAIGAGHSMDIARIETPRSIRRGARAGAFRDQSTETSLRLEDIGHEDFAAALAYEAF